MTITTHNGGDQALQLRLFTFVRAFGFHQPDRTPCGQSVTVSEAHAITELASADTFGQFELGRRLRLEKSSVSRIVAHLVQRGWTERLADQHDGRACLLRLTAAGRQAAAQLIEARAAKFAQLIAAIPESERDGVFHALDVLTEALDDQNE